MDSGIVYIIALLIGFGVVVSLIYKNPNPND